MSASRDSSRRGSRRRKTEVGRTGARFPSAADPDPPAAGPDPPDAETAQPAESSTSEDVQSAEGDAGETFAAEPEPDGSPGPADEADVVEAGLFEPAQPVQPESAQPAEAVTGDESEAELAVSEPEPPVAAEPEPPVAAEPEHPAEPARDPVTVRPALEVDDLSDDVISRVRPYVWTGGRTTSSRTFALETLVSAKAAGDVEVQRDEHRQVLRLCEQPRSVSEIAALLSVPLGAAKALLGAMAEQDLLVVHQVGAGADGPDLQLMERVLRGLRNL